VKAKSRKRRVAERSSLEQQLSEELESFLGPESLSDPDGNSWRYMLGWLGSAKIELFSDEHPPPHFHVRSPDFDAAFAIADCRLIQGQVSGRVHRRIREWFAQEKPRVVKMWNATRPRDCPVGDVTA
jgi:hypothetical protein